MSISCSHKQDENYTVWDVEKSDFHIACSTLKCEACWKKISEEDYYWKHFIYEQCPVFPEKVPPDSCLACEDKNECGEYSENQDFEKYHVTQCESCGDMILSLAALGYSCDWQESIKEQWLDYLEDAKYENA